MLSRIAESLFWIGRYIERSDGTARILEVHLQLLLEDPWIDEDTACRSLLNVMGSLPSDTTTPVTRDDVLQRLAIDRMNPASVAYSLPPCPRDRLERAVGDAEHHQLPHAASAADRQGPRLLPVGA